MARYLFTNTDTDEITMVEDTPPFDAADHLDPGTYNVAILSDDAADAVVVPEAVPVIVTPPVIVFQPLVGQPADVDEGEIAGATSIAHQWYDGDPSDGGAPIIGATDPTITPSAAEYGLTLWRRTTASNDAGSVSVDAEAPDICGAQFLEDFSAFTLGDDTTDILSGGWGRMSSSGGQIWEAEIVASDKSPSGKAINFWVTTTQTGIGFPSDMDSFFGTNGHMSYQDQLYLIRHNTNGNRMAVRGRRSAAVTGVTNADVAAGLNIRINNPYLALPGDSIDSQPGTALTAWTDDTHYWVRQRFEGAVLKVKVWLHGTAEPEVWTATRTHSEALTGRGPGLGVRWADITRVVCYLSAGGNAPAPYWPGFVPPVTPSSDPQDFAAATSQFQITANDGLITIELEDIP